MTDEQQTNATADVNLTPGENSGDTGDNSSKQQAPAPVTSGTCPDCFRVGEGEICGTCGVMKPRA